MSARRPLAALRKVRVGSTNPPKLEGVRLALRVFAPEVDVQGVPVSSDVPEQPVGFAEIVLGARRRAAAAKSSGACDLAVGYEDGLVEVPGAEGHWFNVGCAAIHDGGAVSLGLSSGFVYPPLCAETAVTVREPIGPLFDRLWRARRASPAPPTASALSIGNVGKLTEGALPRAEYTRHAVLCALAPFLHPDLYGVEGVPE